MSNEVERIHGELLAVRKLVEAHGEMSDQVSFNELSAKTMVLSAASFFENEIVSIILGVARDTGSAKAFCDFKYHQALYRKYHTLFNWGTSNVNSFFGLFGGEPAKEWFGEKIKQDDAVAVGIREFMYLGKRRNDIVHGNFAGVDAEITCDEAFSKFEAAMVFIAWLPGALKELAQLPEQGEGAEITEGAIG